MALTPLTPVANSNYAYACAPVNVAGLVRVQIAYPAWGAVHELGVTTDSINITERQYFHDVPGDRNGGPQGPPVEVQKLGEVHNIQLRMSTWNKAEMQQLEEWYHDENADGTSSPHRGSVKQWDVGEVVLAKRGIRLLLETEDLNDTRNYWCCIMREPKSFAIGTKFTEQSLTFEAHRYPCVSSTQETAGEGKVALNGIIYDKTVVAYDSSTYAGG